MKVQFLQVHEHEDDGDGDDDIFVVIRVFLGFVLLKGRRRNE